MLADIPIFAWRRESASINIAGKKQSSATLWDTAGMLSEPKEIARQNTRHARLNLPASPTSLMNTIAIMPVKISDIFLMFTGLIDISSCVYI